MAHVRFDPLYIMELDCGYQFQLTKYLNIEVDQYIYRIPEGFVTDFASVPRILWSLLPPYGKHTRAAVFHDWLYRKGITSRAEADRLFLDGMYALGTGFLTRRSMYRGVRLFGWVRWNECRTQEYSNEIV